mmetsp:Transcript_38723/g.69309  ORF Transcript_38723/g.69309 Transcript_38723/m.69309 type:complete len:215 (+) Transcript_38723:1241-1885(+)
MQSILAVHHHHCCRALIQGDHCLLADLFCEDLLLVVLEDEPPGVHNSEVVLRMQSPLVGAVTRNPWLVEDDGALPCRATDAVDQRRLADIRPAHDCQHGKLGDRVVLLLLGGTGGLLLRCLFHVRALVLVLTGLRLTALACVEDLDTILIINLEPVVVVVVVVVAVVLVGAQGLQGQNFRVVDHHLHLVIVLQAPGFIVLILWHNRCALLQHLE